MWELLAPAGSYESIIAAVNAGADAVYAGGRMFGARAYADNPDEEQLISGLEYCHLHGRKLYLTVNTLLKEQEIESLLYPYLLPYYESGVDGLIVQDFGVMRFVQEQFPDLPIHASTQMTVTGPEGARMLKERGVSRVVTARELSLEEIRTIIAETGVETEVFVHGAMCYSYSGQCLFSSLLGGRSGNRGRCAQPCRLPYRVLDARGFCHSRTAQDVQGAQGVRKQRGAQGARGRQDVPGTAESSGKAACPLSMKDMCALDLLPELLEAGVASLKIEGRMKRPEYTAGVVSVYRKYIDLYKKSGKENYRVRDEDRGILLDLYNRGGFSEGYYHLHNGREMISMYRPNHMGTAAVRVSAMKDGKLKFTALEALGKGDVIELAPDREIVLREAAKRKEAVHLPAPRGWRPREGALYRTKNAGLLEEIRAKYLNCGLQEKVCGELTVSANAPAVLKLACRGIRAECSLEIAEPARSQATDPDMVRRQMTKTGGTAFVFENLKISMDDGLFVPVTGLNELRRAGLSLLRAELLAAGGRERTIGGEKGTRAAFCEAEFSDPRRSGADVCVRESTREKATPASKPRRNILVTTEAQLEAVLESEISDIDTVYLDSLIFGPMQRPNPGGAQGETRRGTRQGQKQGPAAEPERRAEQIIESIKQRGWRCFLSCPDVLRERERAFLSGHRMQSLMCEMDGFLLHTIDELAFFKDYVGRHRLPAILSADDRLYAYNRQAVGFLREQGVGRFTLPAELNFRELLSLDTRQAELNVYGYQALMQTAQCVVKNTDRCTGIPRLTYLADRKNIRFPVLNRCFFCHNTVYNSVPLMLCGCRDEIRQLAPDYVRLSFTIESKEETANMLRICTDILDGRESAESSVNSKTTRGHFRRGVE